ncbi:hypothetical protein BKA65DRAFT_599038 [Rhexocercosporidium sp. MPI-PUGE-AT-0058]|nr:hypothetical protein BKA65DRAFT_599038 [Rhexocercosporidium sp. MPI-PUGE-AT-0058]
MHFSSTLTITTIFLSILPSILGAPLPTPQGFTIGKPCFGSAATGCTLKQGHKREIEELITRAPEPIAEPQGFTIGKPCFGSAATGCTLKQGHKREEEIVARTPEPIAEPAPEPQGFTIGTPCFGSAKTGCTLKKGHKREEEIVAREPEPVAEPEIELETREPAPIAEPQGFTIGKPCFGSAATGCTLKQGHKREEKLLLAHLNLLPNPKASPSASLASARSLLDAP